MNRVSRICLLGFMGVVLSAPVRGGDAEGLISRARAYIGSEETIGRVKSLIILGEEVPEGDGPTVRYTAHLKLPLFQRVGQDDGESLVVMAVDSLEGWMMRRDHVDPITTAVIRPMDTSLYREMRANTIINLYFFRGHEHFRGEVRRLDDRDIEGKPAGVLEYNFGANMRVIRTVHTETGRPLTTELSNDVILRERGEQVVDGLRFPTEIDSIIEGKLAGRITLEQILVNPEIDDSVFEYPSNLQEF